jgi:hypothetical protein
LLHRHIGGRGSRVDVTNWTPSVVAAVTTGIAVFALFKEAAVRADTS